MHWIAPSEKDTATAACFFSFSAADGEKVAQPDEVSPESGKWARVRYSPSSTSSNQFGALNCKVRSARCERPSVRQSHFVIRHCPDPHDATGRFDFVLANPPFNVNAVDTAMRVSARRHSESTLQDLPERQDHERLKNMVGPGRRFPFGLPRTDNATGTRASAKTMLAKPDRRSLGETELHYLWIQLFYSSLKNGETGTSGGRAGFVMANSASDAHTRAKTAQS